jgi:hypothetical protein
MHSCTSVAPGRGNTRLRGAQDKPRHDFVYTCADLSRPCSIAVSPWILMFGLSRVEGSSCRGAAWLLVEPMFTKQGRVNAAQASRKSWRGLCRIRSRSPPATPPASDPPAGSAPCRSVDHPVPAGRNAKPAGLTPERTVLFRFGGGTGRWVVWSLSDRHRRRAGVLILVFPCFMGQNILTPPSEISDPWGSGGSDTPSWVSGA